MLKILAVTGWAVALGLAGLCYVQGTKLVTLDETLSAQRVEIDAAQAAAEGATEKLDALEQQIAQLETTAQAITPEGADPAAAPDGFDPAALVKGIFGAAKDSIAGKPTDEATKNPFGQMFEGERGERMMESSADMTVNLQYGDLWGDLKLSPEKEDALRAALSAHAREQMRVGMKFMRGEKEAEGELTAPTDEDLIAAASEILSADELEKFEAYQAEIPEWMLRQSFEMQLGMFAGGLSEEARAVTVDVLVDHLLVSTPEPGNMPDFGGMQAGYESALVQLESELAPEDLDRVRRFVEQQQAQFEMFSGLMDQPDEKESAAE